MDVTSSGALPLLCTFAVRAPGLPTAMVWKSSVAGSRVMAGTLAAVALPRRPRLMVGFAGSLLAIERQAPAARAPAAVGAKVTLRVVAPDAATVNGAAGVQVMPVVPAQGEMPVTRSAALP